MNGSSLPREVIDGSIVTVSCEAGLRLEGDWLLTCSGGDFINVLPKCVPIDLGKMIHSLFQND